jgi:L-threonylcarbamoyladenylate synthase
MSSVWNELTEARKRLLNQEPVAIPTETVYGLAMPITSSTGIEKVFKMKGRPSFDPLIVHVHSMAQAQEVVEKNSLGPLTRALMKFFWPGPLTFILPKESLVSDRITAGLPTVGVRCPAHPIARRLIREINIPLAAPSANRFGKTSPTRSQHVREEFGEACFVLEGGPSVVGIESTILEVLESKNEVRILRPGQIGPKQIEAFINEKNMNTVQFSYVSRENTPGSEKRHYMPQIPLVTSFEMSDLEWSRILSEERSRGSQALELQGEPNKISLPGDPFVAARDLYHLLRQAHTKGHSWAWVQLPREAKENSKGHWDPLLDRLKRASSIYLEY